MDIELIPGLNNPNLKLKLEELFINCKSFRGCVAFWTIKLDFFSFNAFAKALKKPNSFFCADIQLPTNIKNILEYSRFGVDEIYLHRFRQPPSEYTSNTNLLHSKILLFQLNDTDAEIWIGSHNFTGYAIEGLNLEASISIKCKTSDKIYQEVSEYLEYIKRDFCFKFDPYEVDKYEKLQTRHAEKTDYEIELKKVVSLVGSNMNTLVKEEVVQLLSLNHNEFSKFKTINEEIYLHTLDIDTQEDFLYKCRIEQSGKLDKAVDKLELDFTKPRRFAYIGLGTLSLLKKETKIDKKILAVAKYFVNIRVIYKIEKFQIFEKPEGDEFSFWQLETLNPYIKRLDNYNKHREYKIQEAILNDDMKMIKVQLISDWWHFKVQLNNFYKNIDLLIKGEYKILKDFEQSDSNKPLEHDYYDSELKSFLEKTKKDENLPHYSKSLIEKIIIELEN